jgi:hypothetical protein
MKRILMLSMFLLPLLQVSAQLQDAEQIMTKSRDLTLTSSLNATISLTITEKNGSTRNRTISMNSKSFPDGLEKRFIKFLSPADVRGTAMLILDNKNSADEMWIYLPALKKTRRIVSSEEGKSFMSSEFSNADMSSPSLSDFTNKHSGSSGKDNQWIIESIPINQDKADEYGYSRKVTYFSMDKCQVRKMEFYNFDNELYKIIEVKSVHPMSEGKYMIQEMTANNILTGRKSTIIFSNISDNLKIDNAVFAVQNLER